MSFLDHCKDVEEAALDMGEGGLEVSDDVIIAEVGSGGSRTSIDSSHDSR